MTTTVTTTVTTIKLSVISDGYGYRDHTNINLSYNPLSYGANVRSMLDVSRQTSWEGSYSEVEKFLVTGNVPCVVSTFEFTVPSSSDY